MKLKMLVKSMSTILVIIFLVLGSCAQPIPTPTTATEPAIPTTPTPAGGPKYGGTLRMIQPNSPINLGDPRVGGSGTRDEQMAAPCIETLVRPDEKGFPKPFLASGWEYSKDYKSIIFTLRKGIKFHDGTDFNAQAVKEVLDMSRASPTNPYLTYVTSIDVIDEYNVRLNLNEYQDHFLAGLYERGGWMVSPTALKTKDPQWLLTNPVGTGPFKLVEAKRDVVYKYERNDNYWQEGKPYLDAIEILIIADATTAMLAFQAGQAEELCWVLPSTAEELKRRGGDKYEIVPCLVGVDGIIFDSANPNSPFADIRVRRALCYAIDAKTICDSLGYSLWKVTNQPCISDHWAFNPNVKGYQYDPQKAKKLLAEAGYPNGFEVVINFATGSYSQDMIVAVQRYLKEVGIKAELKSITYPADQEMSKKGWTGLRYTYVGTDMARHPLGFLIDWFSGYGVNNVSTDFPDEWDKALKASLAEPDFNKRQEMAHKALKIIIDDTCQFYPIMEVLGATARYPYLKDARFREFWSRVWTPEDAWLDK